MTIINEGQWTESNQAAGNGTVEPASVSEVEKTPVLLNAGPRIPHRADWVTLPTPYEAFRIKMWFNYPAKLLQEVTSGEEDRAFPALAKIFEEHNGWVGEDGTPLPPANTKEFWEACPNEMAGACIALLDQKTGELPNSIRGTRRP